ncbi:MAG: rRNA maturation RNase YbeY [Candidatus Spechtbacterales bacterium]|nr:rRNA maturation RNase YbeY [Candidatus Spechtbacterales bacterium]
MDARIINETDIEFSKEILSRCVEVTVKKHGREDYFSCTVILVGEGKISQLSEEHYNKKGATDVLSFSSDDEGYAGEIVICPSYIKKQTSDNTFEWEMCHAAVHGTMHLLGIHHEDDHDAHVQLHKKEKEIIDNILHG